MSFRQLHDLNFSTVLALFATFLGRLISAGSIYSMGVYYQSIRMEFGRSHFETSMLFSVSAAVMSGSGLAVEWLLRRTTERGLVMGGGVVAAAGIIASYWAPNLPTLILFLGLVNGLGQGMAYVSLPMAGTYLFPESLHHVAMAIQNTGDGVGLMLFPLLYEHTILEFTWRSSLFIVGGVVLNLVVCGAALHTPHMDKHKADSAVAGAAHKDSVGHKAAAGHRLAYWLLILNTLGHQIGFVVYITFLFPHLTSIGIPEDLAAWIMTTYGLASIATRLGTMFLDNRAPIRRWVVFGAAATIEGICIVAITYLPGGPIWAYMVLGVGAGLCGGFLGSLVCCVALDVLGPSSLARVFTHLMVANGVGSLAGAPIAGILRDWSGSYTVPMCLGGSLDILGGLCLLPLVGMTSLYYRHKEELQQHSSKVLLLRGSEEP